MGKLVQLYIVGDNGEQQHLEFPVGSHLGVELGHPVDRLHLITPPAHRAEVRRLYNEQRAASRPLGDWARAAGGKQARYAYPNYSAVPLGPVSHIIYATDKRGDGYSHYIHEFSEESHGPLPYLAADADGRLWLVGGSYTVPEGGITD